MSIMIYGGLPVYMFALALIWMGCFYSRKCSAWIAIVHSLFTGYLILFHYNAVGFIGWLITDYQGAMETQSLSTAGFSSFFNATSFYFSLIVSLVSIGIGIGVAAGNCLMRKFLIRFIPFMLIADYIDALKGFMLTGGDESNVVKGSIVLFFVFALIYALFYVFYSNEIVSRNVFFAIHGNPKD